MVYVDALVDWGWKLRGRRVLSCHMFTDSLDLDELHSVALRIGMHREWFQPHRLALHYDLTARRREAAISLGAIAVDRHAAAATWRERRRLVAAISLTIPPPLEHDHERPTHRPTVIPRFLSTRETRQLRGQRPEAHSGTGRGLHLAPAEPCP